MSENIYYASHIILEPKMTSSSVWPTVKVQKIFCSLLFKIPSQLRKWEQGLFGKFTTKTAEQFSQKLFLNLLSFDFFFFSIISVSPVFSILQSHFTHYTWGTWGLESSEETEEMCGENLSWIMTTPGENLTQSNRRNPSFSKSHSIAGFWWPSKLKAWMRFAVFLRSWTRR